MDLGATWSVPDFYKDGFGLQAEHYTPFLTNGMGIYFPFNSVVVTMPAASDADDYLVSGFTIKKVYDTPNDKGLKFYGQIQVQKDDSDEFDSNDIWYPIGGLGSDERKTEMDSKKFERFTERRTTIDPPLVGKVFRFVSKLEGDEYWS